MYWLAGDGRRAAIGLGVILLAAAGFVFTRAARVELRYVAMNPVRDAALWQRISDGSASEDERSSHLALASSLAADTLYLPPVVVLRALALGGQPAVADLLFVRAHSYILSHFFADRIFTWLDNYFEAITALDPDNPRVYLWAAQVTKYGQNVDDESIGRSNAFLERGLALLPREPRLHMELGFNLQFEYRGKDDADKDAARLKARDHFVTAAGLPGSDIDPNFLAELFRREQHDEIAIAYALQKYYEATDEQREQLLRRVSALSDEMAAGIKDEETRWKRDLPFVPVSLFSLVGGRPAPGLGEGLLRAVAARGAPAAGGRP